MSRKPYGFGIRSAVLFAFPWRNKLPANFFRSNCRTVGIRRSIFRNLLSLITLIGVAISGTTLILGNETAAELSQ